MSKTIRNIAGRLQQSGISIRHATTADLAGMTSLLGELFMIESDFTPNVRRQRQGLASLMATKDSTLLVAIEKKKIVGMCTLQPLISTAEGGTVGIVEDLVVSEESRGHGIGGMLLDRIEEIARERQMSRLQLLTDLDNDQTFEFYNKHQWEKLNLIAMRKKFS